jgi:phage protein D
MKQPVVMIIGESGSDLFNAWQSQGLTSIDYTDNDGGEADELSFTFAVNPPFDAGPEDGTKYQFIYGWSGGPLRDAGLFTFQSSSLSGDPESGYTRSITARASDFIDADKKAATEHFEETTVGEIFKSLAGQAKKAATVAADLASIAVPYRLRFNQDLSSFADELAEEVGGTLKFANGQMLVAKRNSGKTASGTVMPMIKVLFSASHSFSLSSETRGQFEKVEASYFDQDDGITKAVSETAAGKASLYMAVHPAPSKDAATAIAKASGAELDRNSVSGSVDTDGDVDAMAGAPVKLSGYGAYDAAELIASSIHHTFDFDSSGWVMSIELANKASS